MLTQHTLEQLQQLRLRGMAAALHEQLTTSTAQDLSFEDRLALLVERERTWRDDRRLQRLLKEARLRLQASVEDINFRAARGLERSVVLRLGTAEWVRDHQTVLITGPTGVGKTYLACALAQAACRRGLSVRYYRFGRLLGELAMARADGSYPKELQRLARTDLLVLDDWGLAPIADAERRDLLEVLEDRYGQRASLITSQLPLEHWHDYIGSPTLADAILDRLVHGAHKLNLKGASLRKQAGPSEPDAPTA
ncbi:MAG: IS21-like element helper ATPase IstB [Polaromonas sp.]